GTRYSAHDPALLAWVHATLLDSFLLAYELFVAPLTGAERDRYCEESSSMGPLLGIPPGWLPRTAPELRVYLADALSSGQIEVTATARALSREIVNPPAPLIVRPLLALARWPAIGLLPPGIRAAYGFSWSPGQERALAALGASCRRLIPFVPPAVRHWPAARAAEARERRAAGAVSSTFGIRRSDRGGCSGR
ncbi:MAG TPA: oxygenase MpaB family protein, partial [Candidatus Methylomirabilis sp.]|nr:oxygenase MpaB family protein [Candidatus Methylomirabilis sp.]